MPLEAGLLEILVCPACRTPLRAEGDELVCGGSGSDGDGGSDKGTGCGLVYPIRDGVPVMLVEEARRRD